jgi:phage major head subunit gpT-like protein
MATFRGTAPEVFEARQAEVFFKNYTMEPSQYKKVFNVETSNKAYEDWFEFSGLGQFRTKAEGTPVTYDDPVQGTRRRITHSTFALGFRVTEEALEDAQYDVIERQSSDLGDAGREHEEILAWSVFNNNADANYPTIDGLALASTAHVILKPKVASANTDSNLASPGIALSITGLEDALTVMRTTKSREDRFMPLKPKFLIINPALAHEAYQLLESEHEINTNENQVSTVARSRTGIMALDTPYITDTDNWALVADKSQHKLTFHSRKKMRFDSSTDSQTKDKLFDARYRASVVAKDWRGTYFSNV